MSFKAVLDSHRPKLDEYETIYKHLHSRPELSTAEAETSKYIANHIAKNYPDVKVTTKVGGYGLFGVLGNGEGKTVLLRADMDGLPLEEKTGAEYSSTVKAIDPFTQTERGVMHGEFFPIMLSKSVACDNEDR